MEPSPLDVLIPELFDDLPSDPKFFRYERTNILLYTLQLYIYR
jgi:hypothetical protein